MKKLIIKRIIFALLIILNSVNCYAKIEVKTLDETLNPIEKGITNNISNLTLTIIVMLGIFAILSIFERILTGKRIFEKRFLSNKFVRFIEVILFIVIIALMIYEYIEIVNVYIKWIGIVVSLFALYQRMSNKNRKWAYTAFILDVAIYALGVLAFK